VFIIDERKLTKYIKYTFGQVSNTMPTKVVVLDALVPGPKWRNCDEKPPSRAINVM
jgi:hypothetical protein